MSRAYRIRVEESIRRIIRSSDHVTTKLEMLELLPPQEMAEVLAKELEADGFERDGNQVQRQTGDTVVTVDLETGQVTVRTESSTEVNVSKSGTGVAYDDEGPSAQVVEGKVRRQLANELERDVKSEQDKLQQQVTDELESLLGDIRPELDRAVNRATAAALKKKAAQLGTIREMTEDQESGSLTIVVEV